MTWTRESLRTNGRGKSSGEKRRESSKLGGVGDQREVVVLEWQRKHDDDPNNEGVPGGIDGRGRCAVQSGSGSRKL